MPCPVRALITGKSVLGSAFLQEHLVDLPGDRELGLELLDARLRRSELQGLIGTQADLLAAIDLVLLHLAVDRRLRHPERRRKLRDARSGASKLDDLTTDLRWVPAGHLGPLCSRGL